MGWGCGRMGLVGFGQENEEPLALWHGGGGNVVPVRAT